MCFRHNLTHYAGDNMLRLPFQNGIVLLYALRKLRVRRHIHVLTGGHLSQARYDIHGLLSGQVSALWWNNRK